MTKLLQINGLPVIDSKRKIELEIMPKDIAGATNKDPADCVIARACRRQFHAKEVRVHLGRTYVRMNEGNWLRLRTSQGLRQEIIAFDRGGVFEPGVYTLSPVVPSDRLGSKRTSRYSKKYSPRPKPKSKRKPPHIVSNVRTGPV